MEINTILFCNADLPITVSLERDELVHNLTRVGPSHKIARRDREDVGGSAVARAAAPVGKRQIGKDGFQAKSGMAGGLTLVSPGVCSLSPRRSMVILRLEGLTPLSY